MKPREVTAEEEQRIAAALGLPIRPDGPRRVVEMAPEAAPAPVVRKRKGPRKPVFVDGVRLGRLALWT